MKIFEKVIKRVEPSEESQEFFWSDETKGRVKDGIVFDQWDRDDKGSFFEMYINSEKFQPGDRLRITIEKVEG